ncbi:PilZ domain-containing protein [Bacillus sp. AGMB 02131]|uniref:PilZ domain-containing protein n=1 Tax=Peribacillus faecalis TaxID=2772559 RepID=A0A927CZ48_9BACI|nr:flagellar brake domain-containing protein [Peribacillus faecalis]MBD3110371.1 PilZ domain-containing protein [Peribacillus faecalis]
MLKIGDSLILKSKYSSEPEEYKSKILEFNGRTLFIDFPTNIANNKTTLLADGTKLKATYISNETSSVYLFDTEVLGKVNHPIQMMQMFYPDKEEHIKIQRREYVRIETKIDAAIHSDNNDVKPFTTVTEDISAGGTSIILPHGIDLKLDSFISIILVIHLKSGNIHYVKTPCKVIRTIDQRGKVRTASLKFLDISNNDQQNIMRFVFEKQLEQRNKGI